MKKLFYLTHEGLEELKSELGGLIAQRPGVADRIRFARELGDLSENAEYQTAREEQDRLETRIEELEHITQNAQIIKKPKNGHKVTLGSHVKLKNDGKTKQFQVVGTMEADPLNGKLSDESPIGKALLEKKVGDELELNSMRYKIVEIA